MNPNHVAKKVDPNDYPPYDRLHEAMDQFLHSGVPLSILRWRAEESGDIDLINAYRLIYEDEVFELERRPLNVELYERD